MAKPRGEPLSRELRGRIAAPVANTAALTAMPIDSDARTDGAMIRLGDYSLWTFDATSTAVASDTVIVPAAGSGRFHAVTAPGGSGGGQYKASVRLATAAALAAYTRVDNVITMNAVGALANIDGTAPALGDRVLLTTAGTASDVDNGIWQITSLGGGAAQAEFTRSDDADVSAEVMPGLLCYVEEGTAFGAEWFFCTNTGAIVLNTTAITFVQLPSYVDLASNATGEGASLIGIEDAAAIYTATEVEAALAEVKVIADANDADVATLRPGVPQFNRLIMLGAPGAIVAGDTVTIGADTYEFNAATPPAAGTPGMVWVYQGVSSAESRANFINAVNGVVDPPNITYDVPNTETVLAAAGTTLGTVDVWSADAIGGAITPSAAVIATTETLTTITDIWDDAAMYGGVAAGATESQATTITLTAAMITAGFLEVYFSFTPVSCVLNNRNRPQDEAYTITGDAVVLTLAGGAGPNNQAADVIDVIAYG